MSNQIRTLNSIRAVVGDDGALIQELVGVSTGAREQSLAYIAHPAGTASRPHRHSLADEIYFVLAGSGLMRIDDETSAIGTGNVIHITRGQLHQVTNTGTEHLRLLVACAPAYTTDEVIWE